MLQCEQAIKCSVLDENGKREIEPIRCKVCFDFCDACTQRNCVKPYHFFGKVWYFSLNTMNFRVRKIHNIYEFWIFHLALILMCIRPQQIFLIPIPQPLIFLMIP